MSKSKTQDAWEQVAHFTLLGYAMGLLLGPFNVALILIRELSKWKLPWPYKGQWPPGKPHVPVGKVEEVTQMARVNDTRWDLVFTFAGHALAQATRELLFYFQVWG